MPQTIDFAPLDTPGADEAANPIRSARRPKKQMPIGALGVIVITLPMLAIIGYSLPSTIAKTITDYGVPDPWLSQYGLLLAISTWGLFALGLGGVILWVVFNGEPVVPVMRRLPAFAAANGLKFEEYPTDHRVSGWLFDTRRRLAVYRVSSATGREFEIGELQRVQPESKLDPGMEPAAYVAVRLDRKLPHMAFLSTQARVPNWLSVDGSQLVPLEGDFQTYFRFYAPTGYERDALQVITPDVMAVLVDDAAAWHVEIVDDWVIFTKGYSFQQNTAEDWRRIFTIISAVAPEVVVQGDGYQDEHAAQSVPNVVAPAGRRLRARTPSIVVVALVTLVVWLIAFFALQAPLYSYVIHNQEFAPVESN
ncbi:MAG: hypothetical protein ABIR17_04730 [Pseudolysinimonas sp.]|uniref:hypothetical protein n=1 Tax=Pseudolysinimonas sp. TaxID=2680009 RepID=UPI00326386C2